MILPMFNYDDWFAALDLQDAYFHMAIFPSQRKFLRFVMAGQYYQYTMLPFGLSSAPHIFTKCMAVVTAYLRKRGIHVFPYLDN